MNLIGKLCDEQQQLTDDTTDNKLERCARRWQVVRHDFKSIEGVKCESYERHDMWLSMCQRGPKSLSQNGVWYYKTRRAPAQRNSIYILWRGEASVIIMRAMSELTFLYDHLPNVKFVLMTGQLARDENLCTDIAGVTQ